MIKDIFVVDNVVDIVDVSDACVAGIGSLLVAVAGVFNKKLLRRKRFNDFNDNRYEIREVG